MRIEKIKKKAKEVMYEIKSYKTVMRPIYVLCPIMLGKRWKLEYKMIVGKILVLTGTDRFRYEWT